MSVKRSTSSVAACFTIFILWFPSFASPEGVSSIPAQTNPDSIPFAPAVNYDAGDRPASIFAADLDGDGDADLALVGGCGG